MPFVPALLAFLSAAPAQLFAQGVLPMDILAGRVTDLAGRPVSDAQVEALSLGSKTVRTQLTDSAGRYRLSFSEHAPRYQITARRMGFAPIQRTIHRASTQDEIFIADLQFKASPTALSMVEVTGDSYRRAEDDGAGEATVPNPVTEILARKDSLHLSAVQIVALTDLADSLQSQNTALFKRIQTLITQQKENGDSTDLTVTVSQMLQEASANSDRAVRSAEKLLRPEQWTLIPKGITTRFENMGHSP